MARREDAKKGLATLCIGGGMGCATIVENTKKYVLEFDRRPAGQISDVTV